MNSIAPCLHGTVQFQLEESSTGLNGEDSFISFDFPIVCPRCRERPARLVKVGRDGSIKNNPQRYRCKSCGAYCMAHTSNFWQVQRCEFIARVLETRYSEARSYESLCREYHLSLAQLTRLLNAFWVTVLEEAIALEQLEDQWLGMPRQVCETIQAIWVDETFIKIQGRTWYLIVAVDKIGRVIHHRLMANRSEEALEAFWNELVYKCPHIQLLVTDGWTVYERICKNQKCHLFHVQHIHKDDRRQVQVTQYEYDADRGMHIIKQLGMTTGALLTSEPSIIRYLIKREKDRARKRKSGRPKGRKDTRPRKKKAQSSPYADRGTKAMRPALGKRGRKNVFTTGQPFVLDPFFPWRGFGVVALPPSTTTCEPSLEIPLFQVFTLVSLVAHTFPQIHITSNRIESCFSRFDAWQEVRGRRTPCTVDRDATLFFTYDNWHSRLPGLIKRISFQLSSTPAMKTFLHTFGLKIIQEKSPKDKKNEIFKS